MKVALALTWDGARWPVKSLPAEARTFLKGGGSAPVLPPIKKLTQLLAKDQVREIRICWVPRLRGGESVLALPFSTPSGKRLPFKVVQQVSLGDICGMVYRRA